MLGLFVYPYLDALYGAAYNIQQSLEGFGLLSSNFAQVDSNGQLVGSYWSPNEAAMFPFGLLIAYTILTLLPLFFAACYVLGRVKSCAFGLFILAVPGLLNILGWWPDIRFLPSEFKIEGSGILGEVTGFIPILILGLISGWSITVVVYDTFHLNDKFRSAFDHIWYCAALAAGIFFLADSSSRQHTEDLAQENRYSNQASSYLAAQLRNYYSYCKEYNLSGEESCNWASSVQETLMELSSYEPINFINLGPENSNELYFPHMRDSNSRDSYAIRNEIKEYNNTVCPVEKLSDQVTRFSRPSITCQRVPAQFCRSYPEPLNGSTDHSSISQTVAVASECIIPTLVRSRLKQKELLDRVKNDKRNKHLRWVYFLFFSIVTGGKVANASTKFFAIDSRISGERRRLINLFAKLLRTLVSIGHWLIRKVVDIASFIRAVMPNH